MRSRCSTLRGAKLVEVLARAGPEVRVHYHGSRPGRSKTQEKIDFPSQTDGGALVLDAPFSALDPEYQSSVAENLASQSSQLVLLLSSAAWGMQLQMPSTPHIGRRYADFPPGWPRGNKPIKDDANLGKTITLNEYESDRDESVVVGFD